MRVCWKERTAGRTERSEKKGEEQGKVDGTYRGKKDEVYNEQKRIRRIKGNGKKQEKR